MHGQVQGYADLHRDRGQWQPHRRGAGARFVIAGGGAPGAAPQPICIVYPHARLLPARTRAFVEWMKAELGQLKF